MSRDRTKEIKLQNNVCFKSDVVLLFKQFNIRCTGTPKFL